MHGGGLLGIPQVATTSAGMCDVDIRSVCYLTIFNDAFSVILIVVVICRVFTVVSYCVEATRFYQDLLTESHES